ncbi:MAG: transcriptional repressor NrdR [Clostridiales bacterium]|nr:transcriptional repressor NrdR [Clostridiales bacterium]
MRCQYCGYLDSRVIDSRPTEEGSSIRRRRECLRCGRRFTTYEKIETSPVMVVKKDMRREMFNPEKIKKGLLLACQKRPISMKDIDGIVEKVEKLVHSSGEDEFSSRRIGEAVMDHLRELDEVAYVRFASVYRQFTDVSSFMDELNRLILDGKARQEEKQAGYGRGSREDQDPPMGRVLHGDRAE